MTANLINRLKIKVTHLTHLTWFTKVSSLFIKKHFHFVKDDILYNWSWLAKFPVKTNPHPRTIIGRSMSLRKDNYTITLKSITIENFELNRLNKTTKYHIWIKPTAVPKFINKSNITNRPNCYNSPAKPIQLQ